MKGVLQIYGQEGWHDDVYVIGDKQALKSLRDAIDKALENEKGIGEVDDVMVSDGEGYLIRVIVENADWHEKEWSILQLPYFGDIAKDRREKEIIYPWEKYDLRLDPETHWETLALVNNKVKVIRKVLSETQIETD